MEPLKGLNGPYFEQDDTYAVYIDQHRYWVNLKNGQVMDTEGFEIITNDLADELRAFVLAEILKDPKILTQKVPQTVYVIPTDSGEYVASDSLLRLLLPLPDQIQAEKGNGEERKKITDVDWNEVKMMEFNGKNCYTFSRDIQVLFPDIEKRILEAEKLIEK